MEERKTARLSRILWLTVTVCVFISSHLHCTGHVGCFAVVRDEILSKGIRRIVGLTGNEAVKVCTE